MFLSAVEIEPVSRRQFDWLGGADDRNALEAMQGRDPSTECLVICSPVRSTSCIASKEAVLTSADVFAAADATDTSRTVSPGWAW